MAQLTDSVRQNLPKSRKVKIQSNAAADVPLEINLVASHTGKAIDVKNSAGTSVFSVGPTGGVVRTGIESIYSLAGAKVGSAAGWVVGAAADIYQATMAASQTGGKLVIPVGGLKVGDTITAFSVYGQIESAGNTVTLDADLRAQTNVAADPTDASIGAITQVSVTADTAMAASKTALTEVVSASKAYYILVTATTAASTDIRLLGYTITTTSS
jgi:hypothetical protein